jgi:hypothetical protein
MQLALFFTGLALQQRGIPSAWRFRGSKLDTPDGYWIEQVEILTYPIQRQLLVALRQEVERLRPPTTPRDPVQLNLPIPAAWQTEAR